MLITFLLSCFRFCTRSLLHESLDYSLIDKIPGRQNDRKTLLGELNWIFTAVTDTIAWNVLPHGNFSIYLYGVSLTIFKSPGYLWLIHLSVLQIFSRDYSDKIFQLPACLETFYLQSGLCDLQTALQSLIHSCLLLISTTCGTKGYNSQVYALCVIE